MTQAITHPALAKLAKDNLPALPIKAESSWVAILTHTVKSLTEVKDGRCFVWIKANPVDDFSYPDSGPFANLLQRRMLRFEQ